MRERHFPRLCRSCGAPMARQQDACWSCDAAWDYRSASRNALRVIPGGDAARPEHGDQPPAAAVVDEARALAQERPDQDRLADAAGSLAAAGSRRIGAPMAAVQ